MSDQKTKTFLAIFKFPAVTVKQHLFLNLWLATGNKICYILSHFKCIYFYSSVSLTVYVCSDCLATIEKDKLEKSHNLKRTQRRLLGRKTERTGQERVEKVEMD